MGGLTTIQGHYQGDRIVLAVPQEDGSLSTLTCSPSDSDHYNSAAAKVRQLAAHNAESRAQAQAEAQARHDIDTAAGSLNGAYQAVQQDTSTLSKSSALGEGSRDIQQAQADLGVAQRDLQKTQAAAGTIDCGPDAGTVAADAGSVKADQGSVQADQGSLQADINSAENDIQALDNAEQKFQQAEGKTSDYSVAAPAQSDISSAENAVRNQEAQDKSAMGGYVSQVADLGRQADNLAAAAQQVCGR